MVEVIKELLTLLNNEEGSTYLVGGAVINYLNGMETNDLDFATTLSVDSIKKIFSDVEVSDFLGCKIEYQGYHLDITHLRSDDNIKNGYPKNYTLVDSLKLDALRRDYTINAIYLDKDLQIIDYVNGYIDYCNKTIKPIGDINIIKNDPIRMVRALRFMITYEFSLSKELEMFIKDNIELINTIKKERLEKEYNKIKNNSNYSKYQAYISDLGLEIN